jgi:hypothetical protein
MKFKYKVNYLSTSKPIIDYKNISVLLVGGIGAIDHPSPFL